MQHAVIIIVLFFIVHGTPLYKIELLQMSFHKQSLRILRMQTPFSFNDLKMGKPFIIKEYHRVCKKKIIDNNNSTNKD